MADVEVTKVTSSSKVGDEEECWHHILSIVVTSHFSKADWNRSNQRDGEENDDNFLSREVSVKNKSNRSRDNVRDRRSH